MEVEDSYGGHQSPNLVKSVQLKVKGLKVMLQIAIVLISYHLLSNSENQALVLSQG